jgi:hypothetical protein
MKPAVTSFGVIGKMRSLVRQAVAEKSGLRGWFAVDPMTQPRADPGLVDQKNRIVLMLAGGGVEHTSGGVGTLLLALFASWVDLPEAPIVRVLDTRGAGGVVSGGLHFIRSMAVLIWLCGTGQVALVHAHMTTRGSVVRKCLLCTVADLMGVPTIIHQHGADFLEFF